MKRSLRMSLVAGGMAVLAIVGTSVPASAKTITLSTMYGNCQVDGAATSRGATVTNYTCSTARAGVKYYDAGGTHRTAYGSWVGQNKASVATAQTTMITHRLAQGTKSGSVSGSVYF